MRQSTGGVALIRREHEGAVRWLTQWNRKWGAFHFVAGHKRPEESFRSCVAREVAEELGLRDGDDFTVASGPRVRLEYTAWSESAGEETRYTVELFDVELAAAAAALVEADPDNRWLSGDEIRAGRCADGRPVSAAAARYLSELAKGP